MLTPLDLAHRAMEAAPNDETARLQFYARIIEAEMFLLLAEEVQADIVKPLIFNLSEGDFALVFDREARLADFIDVPTPFVALSGRRLIELIKSKDIGIGLNLNGAPSSMLLPVPVVGWLQGMLKESPQEMQATPEGFHAPKGLPEALLKALDGRLANMSGVVHSAYLVGVKYKDGAQGHMLALIDVPAPARPAVSAAISEALHFSGIIAGQLDITFLDLADKHIAPLKQVGLGFEIPAVILPKEMTPVAPGMDPDKPPKLR